MKILLEIQDSKASFFLELIKNFSFVKTATKITNSKSTLIQEFETAVDELKLAKTGKLKTRNAEEIIDEL